MVFEEERFLGAKSRVSKIKSEGKGAEETDLEESAKM